MLPAVDFCTMWKSLPCECASNRLSQLGLPTIHFNEAVRRLVKSMILLVCVTVPRSLPKVHPGIHIYCTVTRGRRRRRKREMWHMAHIVPLSFCISVPSSIACNLLFQGFFFLILVCLLHPLLCCFFINAFICISHPGSKVETSTVTHLLTSCDTRTSSSLNNTDSHDYMAFYFCQILCLLLLLFMYYLYSSLG